MSVRVGINGFGRIGRNVFRAAQEQKADIEWVAVNDLTDAKTLAHLLKYDSILGPYPGTVEVSGSDLVVDGKVLKVLRRDRSGQAPLGRPGRRRRHRVHGPLHGSRERGQAPGRRREEGRHLRARQGRGRHRGLGVNFEEVYDASKHDVISNASCTTNCLAPFAKVVHDAIGIKHGLMTTIHAYTADQRLQDMPHSDLRRARAAAINLIPASTGAAKAVGLVIPELTASSRASPRAPVPTGSVVDLTFEANRATTVEEVNAALKAAADGPMKGILEYTEDPIVSSDIVKNPHSSIVDAGLTAVLDDTLVKVVSWYDNEWGYSSRCVDLVQKLLPA